MDDSIKRPQAGIAVIIANDFRGQKDLELPGIEKDAKMMKEMFESLQFQVVTLRNINGGLILDEILKVVKTETDCYVLVVSSHGCMDMHKKESWWKHVVYGNDEEMVFVDDIITSLTECHELQGKPKLLFFDVCRSKNVQVSLEENDAGQEVVQTTEQTSESSTSNKNLAFQGKSDVMEKGKPSTSAAGQSPVASANARSGSSVPPVPWENTALECSEDFLIMYPVVPGRVAFASKKGSWLIRNMHKNRKMLEDGNPLTVYLIKVCQDVANEELFVSKLDVNVTRKYLLGSVDYISKKEHRKTLVDVFSDESQKPAGTDSKERRKQYLSPFDNVDLNTADESVVKAKLQEYLQNDVSNTDDAKKKAIETLIKKVEPFKTSACIMHRLPDNISFLKRPVNQCWEVLCRSCTVI